MLTQTHEKVSSKTSQSSLYCLLCCRVAIGTFAGVERKGVLHLEEILLCGNERTASLLNTITCLITDDWEQNKLQKQRGFSNVLNGKASQWNALL